MTTRSCTRKGLKQYLWFAFKSLDDTRLKKLCSRAMPTWGRDKNGDQERPMSDPTRGSTRCVDRYKFPMGWVFDVLNFLGSVECKLLVAINTARRHGSPWTLSDMLTIINGKDLMGIPDNIRVIPIWDGLYRHRISHDVFRTNSLILSWLSAT